MPSETGWGPTLQLPRRSDPRLLRIAEILMSDPRDGRTPAQLCRVTGAGKRSVERLFKQEIGVTPDLRSCERDGSNMYCRVNHELVQKPYSGPGVVTCKQWSSITR
jgi:hypothetical protein